MKLNWFSPLLSAPTDIAHYTARILPALSEQAEITLWTDQEEWDAALEKYAKVRRFTPELIDWAELNRADGNFYNIGNNPKFHEAIWQVSRKHPGVIILHDTRLQHLLAGLYREHWNDQASYVTEMKKFYGRRGARMASKFMTGEYHDTERLAERYPLTALALENSLSVIVHTRQAFLELTRENKWLTAYAPLPFSSRPARQNRSASTGKNPFRLIIFGYIGVNRRLASILEALAQFPERAAFRLNIYGQLWNESEVSAMIRSLGLDDLVRLHGFVPEEELDAALDEADLAFNLRFPTMGEASGSQLRIWSHSLPSLVSATGWYAFLPSETVARVRPEYEVEDIQQHLKRFLAGPQQFQKMGLEGKKLLESEHDPRVYAKTIVEVAREAHKQMPRSLSDYFLQRTGEEIAEWSNGSRFVSTRVAEEIYHLTRG